MDKSHTKFHDNPTINTGVTKAFYMILFWCHSVDKHTDTQTPPIVYITFWSMELYMVIKTR